MALGRCARETICGWRGQARKAVTVRAGFLISVPSFPAVGGFSTAKLWNGESHNSTKPTPRTKLAQVVRETILPNRASRARSLA